MLKKEMLGIWALEAFRRGGADTDRLAQEHPVELARLLKDPRTTPVTDLQTLINTCARLSGDASFGLHMVEYVDITMMGPIGYLMLNAPTVRDLMHVLTNYYRTLYSSADFTFSEQDKFATVTFAYTRASAVCSRHQNEWSLGFLPIFISRQLGYQWKPLRTEFTNDAPDNIADLVATFGPDISFNAQRNAIEFEVATLEATLNEADPYLLDILTRHAETFMREIEQTASIVAATRLQILENLAGGRARCPDVASRLAVSRSTLKRKLADHGCTFRKLRDEVIHEVATEALLGSNLGIGTIATQLGYSETSAFDRAFKRVAGESPTQFRSRRPASTGSLSILETGIATEP